MKLKHFAVFGGIFTVIICLLLFLFIVTADDEESGASNFDFSGLNLSQEVFSSVNVYIMALLHLSSKTLIVQNISMP